MSAGFDLKPVGVHVLVCEKEWCFVHEFLRTSAAFCAGAGNLGLPGLDGVRRLCFSPLLHRTSCLSYWHVCFPVGTATHDGKKSTRLCSAAESAVAVQLWEAPANPSRHLGT